MRNYWLLYGFVIYKICVSDFNMGRLHPDRVVAKTNSYSKENRSLARSA